MSSLPLILSSSDSIAKTRGITLLSSIFMTRPYEVINNFELYYQFFHEILENRANNSITYFTLNDILCSSISRIPKGTQLKTEAVISLLKYISECLTFPATGGHVNAFVTDIFNDNSFTDSAFLLCTSFSRFVSQYYIPLIKILSVTHDKKIYTVLKSSLNENIIRENGRITVEDVFKCVLSENSQISELGAQILNFSSRIDEEVVRLLVPYSSSIQNHVNFASSNDLKQIHQRLSEALLKDTFRAAPDPTPFAPLAHAMFAQRTFDIVDTTNTKKFLNDRPQTHTANVAAVGKPSSLAIHLDKITEVPLELPVQQKPTSQANVKVENKPQLKFLKTFAAKKGGKLSKSWQRRYFEFFPSNKCLVWRVTDTPDGVKGVLFLDHNVKVERSNLTLILEVKGKTHSIQFDNQATVEEWFTTLQSCTRE
ncbi:hypothetical protein TRFO_02605 [Tritrichomonas foetus]|uniref:PH domain-containing protein n=1 Tax=Tritrichomonas foetus TaxID=1144522 RepID=A0A1J4L389_9EUKA|nr:hypothetical protein TRFO_02605 [Tritrichomonas foetus]|eukprot:OHT17544.1 hypothetical protein TRFO_02605 [Tritrichomonas foetus]